MKITKRQLRKIIQEQNSWRDQMQDPNNPDYTDSDIPQMSDVVKPHDMLFDALEDFVNAQTGDDVRQQVNAMLDELGV